ncbi:MAG: hypothetical protein AB8F74_13910 [Saprospiraceae bacterium]
MGRLQITIILLFAVSTIMVGQNQAKQALEWKTFNKDNYEIMHPADWEVDKSGQMGTSFILFSPQAGPTDNFKENINLVAQDLMGNKMTLDQYLELSMAQIKALITDSEIITSERIKEGDREYQKVIYSGKQGIYDLKFEQYFQIVEGKAYVLTFTCANDQFEEYQPLGEKILDSFKFR